MAIYKIGSSGDDVKKLQTQLKAAGFDPGGIDGIYGNKTAAAVTAYQKANNLSVDGIAGQQTLGSLYNKTTTPAVGTQITPINKPTTTPATTVSNQPDITGLTGLRDYGAGKGLDIGWSKDTGVTVDGNKVDTSGLVLSGDKYYGSLDQLNKIFAPHEAPKPYVDPYEDKINAALDKILGIDLNKPYDVTTDPLYWPMKQQYDSAGQTAFNNQIGRLSALTGGRPSTAAVGTATAAQNDYAQQFAANVLPSLINQEQQRRQTTADNLFNQLAALQGLGSDKYAQHRDTVGDYRADRAYNRTILENDRKFNRDIFEKDRDFEYQVTRDNVLDDRWMQQFDYQKQQNIIKNAMDNRQISISEGNAALARAKFNYDKEQDALNKSAIDDKAAKDENLNILLAEMRRSKNPTAWLEKAYNDGVVEPNEYNYLYEEAIKTKIPQTGDPVVDRIVTEMLPKSDKIDYIYSQAAARGLTKEQIDELLKIAKQISDVKYNETIR